MMRWLALAVLLIWAAAAHADELRPASIQFVQIGPQEWDLAWKQPLAAPGSGLAIPSLPRRCRLLAPPSQRSAPLALLGHAEVRCEGLPAGWQIGWSGIRGRGEALLRVVPLQGPVQAFRLTAEQPIATIAQEPGRWQVAGTYGWLGVEHILTGWDHLLFVVALVMLVRFPRRAIVAATAFTLAHSLTLAAVTLGFAGLPQNRVEALIALSILMLAVEIARGTADTLTRRLPWLAAFGFGLLHGFGFAGALAEIGLPQGEVPMALLAFNLGVEAGQVAVIAAVLAGLSLLRRAGPTAEERTLRIAAYGIGTVAAFWLIDRALF